MINIDDIKIDLPTARAICTHRERLLTYITEASPSVMYSSPILDQ